MAECQPETLRAPRVRLFSAPKITQTGKEMKTKLKHLEICIF